jgi:hypothetical protein
MISEFNLGMLLIVLPLVGGGTAWFNWELKKSKVAYQSFAHAREELIQTHHHTKYRVDLNGMSETIELFTLAELDQGSSTLSVSDSVSEVSQLSGDAWRFYRQVRDWDSTK